MLTHALRRLTLLVAVIFPFGCGDLTGLGDIFGGRLASVSVHADQGTVVEAGDTLRLTATGSVDGLQGLWNYAPILDAIWATSDPTVARVEALPPPPPQDSFPQARTLIRGVRPGTARVTASSGGITGEVTVRVIPVLATIRLSPPNTITVGDTVRIAAVALEPGGSEVSDVPLTFAATGGVRLNGYDRAGAYIIATAAGPAALSARFRRVTGEVAFTVVSRPG
jgi:hypothetical protein